MIRARPASGNSGDAIGAPRIIERIGRRRNCSRFASYSQKLFQNSRETVFSIAPRSFLTSFEMASSMGRLLAKLFSNPWPENRDVVAAVREPMDQAKQKNRPADYGQESSAFMLLPVCESLGRRVAQTHSRRTVMTKKPSAAAAKIRKLFIIATALSFHSLVASGCGECSTDSDCGSCEYCEISTSLFEFNTCESCSKRAFICVEGNCTPQTIPVPDFPTGPETPNEPTAPEDCPSALASTPDDCDPVADFSGTWSSVFECTCDNDIDNGSFQLTIIQTGDEAVYTDSSSTYMGTVCGNVWTFSSSSGAEIGTLKLNGDDMACRFSTFRNSSCTSGMETCVDTFSRVP